MDDSFFMTRACHCIDSASKRTITAEERQELAIELAGWMLREAKRIQTRHERRTQQQLARMMRDPIGKVFTTSMTDECFRSDNSMRVADQLVYLLKKFGVPHFPSAAERLKLKVFEWIGRPFASFAVPVVKHVIRKETGSVILPGEPEQLFKHIGKRYREGVRVNLNHLGEAILGEEEAINRLNIYLKDLANPAVEYISVKVSTIFSQINLLGWEETLSVLAERLKQLYRAAKNHVYIRPNGEKIAKFVNLDMEEYRDLHLTVEVFRRVLDDAEFYNFSAGIVLQSYLPDSFLIQQELTAWAMHRVANGGGVIKIRLVKGANLAMEKVEASLRDWPQAPYLHKSEVDANFKRMLLYGCQKEHAKAVHLGVGSHNLFDIAYAMIVRAEQGLEQYVSFEMLEGMADHMRRVVQQLTGGMLLYCPAATREEFQYAVAYLVRRLDENTAPENFLRHSFDMLPGSVEWQEQLNLFLSSCRMIDTVGISPRRQQNRNMPSGQKEYFCQFHNIPDSDWSLPQQRKWAEKIIREWSKKKIEKIPLVIGGQQITQGESEGVGVDPSFPSQELYRYALGGEVELKTAIETAEKAAEDYTTLPLRERLMRLRDAADALEKHRGDLIGAMICDTGKTAVEADVEVSEAVDFANYYCKNIEEWHFLEDIQWQAKGVVVVAPPWNFPCSIPAGGILAALAAGNSVIFKPAPEAVFVGWQLINILWESGIDKSLLQFFCCDDDPVGSLLVQDPRVSTVILTGATSTAQLLMKLRPGIDLLAETGGKNAMIITRMADRDLAIKDLIQSAFGHAGQKCSACSLAILEKEVYDDPHFKQQLRDAAASLHVGSPWNLFTKVNPLIRAPEGALLRALTTLEDGEEWLLQPKQDPDNPCLWSPGIKYGVKPGSYTHQTEFFGPVLGVMCAENLDKAIAMANGTPYGLTSGIHTLDEREQRVWSEKIVAGNCYINRGITGAIVQRQPFGGCKDSSFGPGAKAGGPNYLLQLMRPKQRSLPKEREVLSPSILALTKHVHQGEWDLGRQEEWKASVSNYAFYWHHYFAKEHDPSQVIGEDNLLRYVPRTNQVLRVQESDDVFDVLRVIAATVTSGGALAVSILSKQASKLPAIEWLKSVGVSVVIEAEEQFISRIIADKQSRVRFLSTPNERIQQQLAQVACRMIIAPVAANGRIELFYALREVNFSISYHRYGYLGFREHACSEKANTCQGCQCAPL